MEKFVQPMQKVLMPIANKLNKSTYVCAIRDGFALAMPYLMVGSILTSLSSISFFDNIISENVLTFIRDFLSPTSTFSSSITALLVVIGIAYSLAKEYKLIAIHGAVVSMVFTKRLFVPSS